MRDLLSQVSRSFYLSLKWLPAGVREPISLAYLLARTSDTIADTTWIPTEQRLASLEQFGRRISGADSGPLNFKESADKQGDPAEGVLLSRTEDSLALLDQLTESDRALVRRVLETIISGQTLDLQRFANASASNIVALSSVTDLDDYTYRVAGCVGDFWTRVCLSNLPAHQRSESHVQSPGDRAPGETPLSLCALPETKLIDLGIRYGQGLQLLNILRDLPRDLRQGRCYLPTEQLNSASLTPHDLLDPESEPALRPVYDALLDRAHALLADGWTYTNAYPRSLARIRISCALPLLIGWRTIDRLRTGRILQPDTRIKVLRVEVKRLVLQTILRHPFESLWKRLGN